MNLSTTARLADGLIKIKIGWSSALGGYIVKVRGRGRSETNTNRSAGFDTIAEAQNAGLDMAARAIERMMGEIEFLREQAAEAARD